MRDAFLRSCQAAEGLSTLGYAEESRVVWCSAFARLTNDHVAPGLLAQVRQLLADDSAEAAWQDRARTLSAECAAQLPATPQPPLHKRFSLLAGAAVFVIALITFAVRLGTPIVTASGEYAPAYGVSAISDGDTTTEWLLPDRWVGHLDFALPRRRAVREVVLTNGHNQHYMDRAAKKVRAVLYDDVVEVDSAEVSFEKIAAEPVQRTAKLAGKQGTRVRVYVLEHFGLGSSLAEVAID